MAGVLTKTTPEGWISVEITLSGEAPKIPMSEVLDLIRILRETADNLEETFQRCSKGQHPAMLLDVGTNVH
mgnify:CR=1 FL=1